MILKPNKLLDPIKLDSIRMDTIYTYLNCYILIPFINYIKIMWEQGEWISQLSSDHAWLTQPYRVFFRQKPVTLFNVLPIRVGLEISRGFPTSCASSKKVFSSFCNWCSNQFVEWDVIRAQERSRARLRIKAWLRNQLLRLGRYTSESECVGGS